MRPRQDSVLPPDYVRRPQAAQAASLDRSRLLLLVLESGQAFLMRARGALERGDVDGFVADLARTREVVVEMTERLDRTREGEVAASLERLHGRMVGELARANAARTLDLVDEVLRAYGPIVDAYRRALTTDAPA
jgi:flagellar biosynthetic protein FliS